MDCSMPLTFDQYSYCSLGCQYCFAYAFKVNKMNFTRSLRSVNSKKMIYALNGEAQDIKNKLLYKHFYSKRFVLHWGGLADPFCNFEKTNHIGYEIVSELAKLKYPTLFSFKGTAILRPNFQKLFLKYATNKNFAFQISIICPNDDMSKQIEIGVPVTSKRIEMIKMLSDMGYYTILRLRPFIIGISDDGLGELLDRCAKAGIKGISIEFFALDQRQYYNKGLMKRYKHIGDLIGTKNIIRYFSTLSPNSRGSYLRLNRLVKEIFIKQIYTFCIKNNILFACSDPDYKELNMSGSCCGLPSKYPDNPELQNWTKNQLTYHLKEARKIYHAENKIVKLKFHHVFNPEHDSYLLEQKFEGFALSCVDQCRRRNSNHLSIANTIWNNLQSPSNPRNYFHGKLLPVTLDSNENYIFKYNPSEYEEEWSKEGIDLTK